MSRTKVYISFILLSIILFPYTQEDSEVSKVFSVAAQDSNAVPDSEFVVFDCTGFREKPDLTEYGLKPIHIIYTTRLWGKQRQELKGTSSMPHTKRIAQQADQARLGNKTAVIDIEHWPVEGDEQAVQKSIDRYIKVFEQFKKITPGVSYGFYGVPPIRDYWSSIKDSTSSRYKNWEKNNDRLQDLASKVDVLYPSLYTFYQDRERWVKYAIASIKEARKYNGDKPVYVFLWPEYHPSNDRLRKQFIASDFWELQLKTARQYADGIVIWTPSRLEWDDNASWWKITKEFMQELNSYKEGVKTGGYKH